MNSGRSLRFTSRGSLVVYVSLDLAPLDSEWDACLHAIREVGRSQGCVRILVTTDGSVPTPKQRKSAAEVAAVARSRTAFVTDDMRSRLIVTALRWLGVDIKAFAGLEMERAAQFLELSAPEREWALEKIQEMRQQLRTTDGMLLSQQ